MYDVEKESPLSGRMRIGDCIVDLSLREVLAPGAAQPYRITPKALGVLRALASRPAEVLGRDELFALVWPDTLPTNDVLTQAVTQLRKALSASGRHPAGATYIETIAKTGYRLRAEVEMLAPVRAQGVLHAAPDASDVDQGASPVMVSPRARVRRVRRWVLWAVAAMLLGATAVMAGLLWQSRHAVPADGVSVDGSRVLGSPPAPYRVITSTAGFHTWPSISPDGVWVAYTRESGGHSRIVLQTTANDRARPLLDTPLGHSDRFPVWSPDGLQLAFTRHAPDGGCEVLIASAAGQVRGVATGCEGNAMLSYDWSPDGKALVFGAMTDAAGEHGIRVLDIASGRWRALAYRRSAGDLDHAPKFSPDGRQVGFVRNPQAGDFWVVPAEGGTPLRVSDEAAEIRGWSWEADGQGIVFGRRVGSEVRVYRLDLRRRTLRDLGLSDAQAPVAARNGKVLAFMQRRPQFRIYRVSLQGGSPPQALFASTARDTQPMMAPDGRQLVFTSDRSGSYALWWAQVGEESSLRVVRGVRPDARQPASWSPDSRYVLVLGHDEEGRYGVYEVSPSQARAVRLPVPVEQPLQALYVAGRDDRILVVERNADHVSQLSLFDRAQQPWRRLASVPDVSQVRMDPRSGRVLFTRFSSAGVWSVDPELTADSVHRLDGAGPGLWSYRNWDVDAAGQVAHLGSSPACASLLVSLPADAPDLCLHAQWRAALNGFSLSPDGDAAYVSLAAIDGADIAVMDTGDD